MPGVRVASGGRYVRGVDETAGDGAALTWHREGGAGEPAVVLPGGPCRGVEYLEDLAGLADDRPLVVLHPRGAPTTRAASRGWWLDADDVVALADRLGLDAVDVVAHSAGTRLALALLARHPARVRSLLLVTPSAAWLTGTPHDGDELLLARDDPDATAALDALLAPPPADQAELLRQRELVAAGSYSRWTDRERRHAPVGEQTLAAVNAWSQGVPDDAAAQVLAAPRRPTLVVAGAEDALSGRAPVAAYAAALSASLTWIPDCGHYPWVEQPETFRSIAADWLRRPASDAGSS